MATPTNGSGNLVDEFEEAFLSLMQVLTKEEENFNSLEKDETRVDIDLASNRCLDIARQLEAFFLQKRFVLSVLKPELIVKEEIHDLKAELQRKDELLKRHYDKIPYWQNMLADVQGWGKSAGSSAGPSGSLALGPPAPMPAGPSMQGPSPGSSPNPAMLIQQQMQHQQHQHHQQQQQQQQQQMQMPIGPGGMMSPQQSPMFMSPSGQRASPFNQPAMMPGPLAFLEKTTSNIGMSPDGRR